MQHGRRLQHTQWKPTLHEMSYIMSLFYCGKENAWMNSREYGISLSAWMTDSYKHHCMNGKDMNTVESLPLINFYIHLGLLKCQALYVSFCKHLLTIQKHDKAITGSVTWQGALQCHMLAWISMRSLIIPLFHGWQLISGKGGGWNNLIQHASSKERRGWFSTNPAKLCCIVRAPRGIWWLWKECVCPYLPCLQCKCV